MIVFKQINWSEQDLSEEVTFENTIESIEMISGKLRNKLSMHRT